MNRTMLKKICLYAGGFVLGGGIGYLLADHFITKAERLMDEYPEVDEDEPENKMTSEFIKKEVERTTEWAPEDLEAKPKAKRKKIKPQPTDYTKFTKQDNKKSLEEEVHTRIDRVVEEEKAGINIITLEIFADPLPVRDKVVLTYYQEDDTLRDEEDNIVDARSKLIGNALEKFGTEKDGDPDTVYVRNGRNKTDYEVIRVKGSYQEMVLGEKPEGKPKPKKRPARKTRKVDAEEEE